MVRRGELFPIGGRLPHMSDLRWNRRHPVLVQHGCFRWRRTHLHAAGAVVTDSGVGDVNNFIVVDVTNHCGIHVGHAAVIGERVVVPVTAFITAAHVSVAVVDPAIVADVRAPVTSMPHKPVAGKAPVGRCPERADIRS